jgi:tellurite resistance protein TehA-like permease
MWTAMMEHAPGLAASPTARYTLNWEEAESALGFRVAAAYWCGHDSEVDGVPAISALIPPASWTIVMSFGVVSIDLGIVGRPVLSAIALWVAALVWLLLVVVLAAPLAFRRGRFRRDTRTPVVIASVAATAVLGTRLAIGDHPVVAAALLAVAAVGWVLLLPPILRHWRTPTTGIFFVVGVATDSMALLSATLAVAFRAGWLLWAAALLLLVGLTLYVVTAARFDLRQLLTGHGDHWIAGGALAIAALCAGKITQSAGALGLFTPLHQALTVGTLVIWALAVAWIVPLVITEVVRPRFTYDVRRWATVFPFGMYAACSVSVGQVTGLPGITATGRTATWAAVAITLLVLTGLIRQVARISRTPEPRSDRAAEPGLDHPSPLG